MRANLTQTAQISLEVPLVSRVHKICFVALCAILNIGVATAQTDSVVLRGRDVREDALVDLLSPRTDTPSGIGTRQLKLSESIKVEKKGGCSANAQRQSGDGTAAPRAAILISFETNSTILSDDAKRQLDVVARALGNDQLNRFSFLIEGHADPRGGAADNMRLSKARADSVREYLVTRGNVENERLVSVGKGDSQLMNTCNVAAAENRRVAFVTVTQK